MLKETQTGLSRAWSRAEGALLPSTHEFRKLVHGAADPGQGFNLAALLIGRHLATPSRVSRLGTNQSACGYVLTTCACRINKN